MGATPLIFRDDWIAQEGSQRLFLSCPVPEVCYEGTRGPGKTDALLMKFAKHCGRGFGAEWRGIIFRETYKQLKDIIKKSKRRFYKCFPGIKYNESAHMWTWPTGETLILSYFRTEDDYANYHGHEYPFIAWEELTNWITNACYEIMKSCNRSSYPGMPRIYASTCNPFGKGHSWVKDYFITPAPRGTVIYDERSPQGRVAIHGNVLENKILLAADPNYLSVLDSIGDINRRKAWRFGSWDINVGSMFDDVWNSDVHILRDTFDVPRDWTIERSYDHGEARPFSVGWWARPSGSDLKFHNGKTRSFPRGSYIRIGEWYGYNGEPNKGLHMLSSKIAQGIIEREQMMGIHGRVDDGPADSSIFTHEDGNCIADNFLPYGINWKAANKAPGSRIQGWSLLRELMDNATDDVLEEPGLWVTATCKQFIRTVPGLPRDEDNLDDVDTAAEDHIGDESRYEVLRKPHDGGQEDMHS